MCPERQCQVYGTVFSARGMHYWRYLTRAEFPLQQMIVGSPFPACNKLLSQDLTMINFLNFKLEQVFITVSCLILAFKYARKFRAPGFLARADRSRLRAATQPRSARECTKVCRT